MMMNIQTFYIIKQEGETLDNRWQAKMISV